jgi:hypothetical protein
MNTGRKCLPLHSQCRGIEGASLIRQTTVEHSLQVKSESRQTARPAAGSSIPQSEPELTFKLLLSPRGHNCMPSNRPTLLTYQTPVELHSNM